jgi:hypothetical protein
MTDPRAPIFAAVRQAAGRNVFNDASLRDRLDAILDDAGIGRAAPTPAPTPTAPSDPIPAGYFEMLARIESGNRPYVQAPTSSASGLYQFIRATWIGEGGKWGPTLRPAFGGLRPSVEEQRQRARSFTMKNVTALRNAGVSINSATLYAAHFLGAGTAIKMLRAPLTASAATIAGASAARANPSILGGGRTVAQFRQWLERKTGVKP